jgi:hypothetical protein
MEGFSEASVTRENSATRKSKRITVNFREGGERKAYEADKEKAL